MRGQKWGYQQSNSMSDPTRSKVICLAEDQAHIPGPRPGQRRLPLPRFPADPYTTRLSATQNPLVRMSHAQDENPQGNEKAISLDRFGQSEAPGSRHQPPGVADVEEASPQSPRDP